MRRASVPMLLCAALALSSCEALRELASGLEKPTASLSGVRFQDLDLESMTLAFDLDVDNPYPVAMPIGKLGYELASGGKPFASGATDVAQTVPASGSSEVTLPVKLRFAELLDVLTGVRPGQVVPYRAKLDLGVDAPGVGPMTLPLEKEGELPVPAPPEVRVNSLRWSKLSFSEAAADLDLAVRNPNDFGFALKNLQYALDLGGRRVGAAEVASGKDFASGETESVKLPLSFKPSDLGMAAFQMLSGDAAKYRLQGRLEVDTPFGPLSLPYDSSGSAPLED